MSALQVGQKAPNFELPGDDGHSHSLLAHKGRWVVLYFYPKDMTPGCTSQSCDFSDKLDAFEELDAVVYGVSRDSLASHARFKSKHSLGFTLLSDPELSAHKSYGAYGEKMLYGKKVLGTMRTTVLIDPKGRAAKVWPKVRVKGHVSAVLNALAKLNDDLDVGPLQSMILTR